MDRFLTFAWIILVVIMTLNIFLLSPLKGGGGMGASASATHIDGAISSLYVRSFGNGYEYGESEVYDWIVPVQANPGSGFKAFVKGVQWSFDKSANR